MRGLEDFTSLNPGEQYVLMSRMLNIFRVGEEAYMLYSDGRLDDRYCLGISRHVTTFVSIWGVRGFPSCCGKARLVSQSCDGDLS